MLRVQLFCCCLLLGSAAVIGCKPAANEDENSVTAGEDLGFDPRPGCNRSGRHCPPLDPPTLTAFTAPADNASFGPGEGCTGRRVGANQFGLHVVAKADKRNNRVAAISVNNTVVANSVTIAQNGTIDECVPVRDGTNAVTVRLTSTAPGGGVATMSHQIAVHFAKFTAPADNAMLSPADTCLPAAGGYGASVTLLVDRALSRQNYTISSGDTRRVTGRVPSGAGPITVCLPLPEAMSTITASIGPNAIMPLPLHVTVVITAPPAQIVLDTPPALDPQAADYRAGLQTVKWTAPAVTGGIASYELRCDYTALAADATVAAKDDWWTHATTVTNTIPATIPPAATSVQLHLRPQEPNHCVLRAANPSNALTPIDRSTDLTTLVLRQAVLGGGAMGSNLVEGSVVAAAGDVNGDGKADVLVGGFGHAELIFGNADPTNAQKVVFTGAGGGVGDTGVGSSLAGIGDFNHDSFDDFVIADPNYNGFDGRVMVFFGRAGGWPTVPVNLESGPGCAADLCIEDPAGAGDAVGIVVNAAGDFDGDGNFADLAIGTPFYPYFPAATADYDGQVLVVLGSDYEQRSCSGNPDCRSGVETCQNSVCTLNGQTFWGLRYSTTGAWLNAPSGTPITLKGFAVNNNHGGGNDLGSVGLGGSIAALGNVDTVAGDDLVIGAPQAKLVHYLSGRAYSGTTGFTALTGSALGLPDPTSGVPAGASPPFKSGATDAFGFNVCAVGNLYDVSGALVSSASDVAIGNSLTNEYYVYPQDRMSSSDPGFSAARVRVFVDTGNPGTSLATAFHARYGLLGDLDKDGKADLMSGTRGTKEALLWYHDRFAAKIAGGDEPKAIGFHMTSEASDTADLAVQYVGDFNGDTYPDVVVGDSRANALGGQAVLFY